MRGEQITISLFYRVIKTTRASAKLERLVVDSVSGHAAGLQISAQLTNKAALAADEDIGYRGDGMIFVSPTETAMRIRDGGTDEAAFILPAFPILPKPRPETIDGSWKTV